MLRQTFLLLLLCGSALSEAQWTVNFNNNGCCGAGQETPKPAYGAEFGPFPRTYTMKAKHVTGINSFCGEQVEAFNDVTPSGELAFAYKTESVGIFDPAAEATNAILLTPQMCADPAYLDRPIASREDPGQKAQLEVLRGMGFGVTADPRAFNRPVTQVPVPTGMVDGSFSLLADPTPGLSPLVPVHPHGRKSSVTLREWLKADATFTFKCRAKNDPSGNVMSIIDGEISGLLPGEFYSVWAMFYNRAAAQTIAAFGPVGVGGNAYFYTDENGYAKFQRKMHWCPFDYIDPNGDEVLLDFLIAMHGDRQVTGALPETWEPETHCYGPNRPEDCGLTSTLAGTVTFDVLMFDSAEMRHAGLQNL